MGAPLLFKLLNDIHRVLLGSRGHDHPLGREDARHTSVLLWSLKTLRLAGRGATWKRCASERLHLYPGKQMLGVLCYVAQVASSNTWAFVD